MRTFAFVTALVLVSRLCLAQSFEPLDRNSGGVGVPHYVHPEEAHYRLIGGVGANAGRATDEPLATTLSAQYRLGPIALGGQFISNSSTGGTMPRKNFSEVGALVGYTNDYDVAAYASKPQYIHTSLAIGGGFVTYSERWRRFRRGQQLDTAAITHPNVFQTAVSLPVQAQAIYEPWRYIGIGAMLWLDVNSIAPSYGASIVLEARY